MRRTPTPAACAQDLICSPPSAGEAACEITWGEMFSVLPFGNRTVILTLTGAQLEQAFLNGFSPVLQPGHRHRALPAGLGSEGHLRLQRHHSGRDRHVEDAAGHRRTGRLPIGPADTVRFVTNDFMYTGGDGYTVFAQGTNVLQPGDDLLQVAIDYVAANSPVGPVVEGRITGP